MNDSKNRLSPLAVSVMTFVLALGILSGVLVSKRVGFDIAGAEHAQNAKAIFINGLISSAVPFLMASAACGVE